MCKYKKIFGLEFFPQKYINFIELSDFGKILKISENYISTKKAENNIGTNNFNNLKINNKYLNKKDINFNDEKMGLKFAKDFENSDLMI